CTNTTITTAQTTTLSLHAALPIYSFGRRHMRAATQIGPRHRAIAGDVVVHRQSTRSDFHGCTFGCVVDVPGVGLQPDQFELVRFARQLYAGFVIINRTALELLPRLDDLAHARLDSVQIFGMERLGNVEIVIEAVGNRWTDSQGRLGEQFLDGLGHDMGGGVPQNIPAVWAVDSHGFNDVAVRETAR